MEARNTLVQQTMGDLPIDTFQYAVLKTSLDVTSSQLITALEPLASLQNGFSTTSFFSQASHMHYTVNMMSDQEDPCNFLYL